MSRFGGTCLYPCSMTAPEPTWRHFWAKTDRGGYLRRGDAWTHPLWAHLLDVACVAEVLFERLPAPVRASLARQLGVTEEQAGALLALVIGLHDAGKATPSFQSQHGPSRAKLEAAGLSFGRTDEWRHHGHASIPIVLGWIDLLPDSPARPLLRSLAAFVGFHHGRFDAAKAWESDRALGDAAWREQQQALVAALAEAWMQAHGGWPALEGTPDAQRDGFAYPPDLLAVAGWTTLADWVGSMAEYMPANAAEYGDLGVYLPASRAAVRNALAATKLNDRAMLHAGDGEDGFRACFRDFFEANPEAEPRALQRTTASLKLPNGPALVIVEAPTGEGKSEAAFHLAARLQTRRADGGRGVYVALPTQATSNGLFPRFLDFLKATTDGAANVQLVHGASGLNADLDRLLEPQDRDEAAGSSAYAARWFLPSKRGLLAPYGVGTVDQALLGALVARHFFLRLYGLAGKVVVFDEVHAYDTYMAALFAQLLRWLRALDCDVVVLSATLPATMRHAFLKAWGAKLPEDEAGVYPAVTVAEAGAPARACGPFDTVQAERTARTGPTEITFADSDERAVVEKIVGFVKRDATVGVIVNLVDRAQRVFSLLNDAGLDADLVLLHARFPFAERQAREHYVVGEGDTPGRFGKHRCEVFGERPAVLVATQIAEQSLDLDVDILLTDLAPVDLLLQRAGRMHRHELARPDGFERPRLLVLCPNADADDLPTLAPIGGQRKEGELKKDLRAVYLSLPLFKTYRLLRERRSCQLPDDYRPLIEAVYGPGTDDPPPGLSESDRARWDGAIRDRDTLNHSHKTHARDAGIPSPERLRELFSRETADRSRYDEHDDAPVQSFQPVTRLGRDSVEVVCLIRRDGRVTLDGTAPLPDAPADDSRLPIDDVRDLLRRGIRLSRVCVVRALRADETAGADRKTAAWWSKITDGNPALAYHHAVVFEHGDAGHGRCTLGGTTVALDPDLGIVYDPDRLFDR